MEYEWDAFGKWVQESRTSLGYKQAAFARKLALHRGTLSHIEKGTRSAEPERRKQIVDLLVAELRKARRDVDSQRVYITAGLPFGTDISPTLESFRGIYISPYGKRSEIHETLIGVLDALELSWGSGSATVSPLLVKQQASNTYSALLNGGGFQHDFVLALHTIRAGIRLAQAEEAVVAWFERSQRAIKMYDHVEQFVIEQVVDRFKHDPDFAKITYERAKLIALRAPLYREIGEYEFSIKQADRGATFARDIDDVTLLTDLLRNKAHVRAVQGQSALWEEAMHDAEVATGRRGIRDMALKGLHTYHLAEGKRRLAFDHRKPVPLPNRMRYSEEAIALFALSRQQLEGWELQDVAVGSSRHPLIPRVSAAQCRIWLDPRRAIGELEALRVEAQRDHPSLVAKIDYSIECARQLDTWRQHNPMPVFNLDARYKA